MIKEMICIECPRGCTLSVTLEDGRVAAVTGNMCKRGITYATDECEAPRRVVTGTVRASDGSLLPVKTAAPVLRERMMEVMGIMAKATATLPVRMGDVVIPKIDGEVDLVACRTLMGGEEK